MEMDLIVSVIYSTLVVCVKVNRLIALETQLIVLIDLILMLTSLRNQSTDLNCKSILYDRSSDLNWI